MLNYKIFQTYYDKSQINKLDPAFEPFDNCENLHPEFREYWVNLLLYHRASDLNLDHWGSFSQAFASKHSGLTGAAVHEIIEQNPGYDVYFFNHDPYSLFLYFNVWEHGEHYHKHQMLTIMKPALEIMGLDPRLLFLPNHKLNNVMACTCVASKHFWEQYLALAHEFLSVIPKLPDSIQQVLSSGAGYSHAPELWYFPFIQERFFSLVLMMNQNKFKIFAYHKDYETIRSRYQQLHDLKDQGIKMKDAVKLRSWDKLRKQHAPYLQNFSVDSWIDIFVTAQESLIEQNKIPLWKFSK